MFTPSGEGDRTRRLSQDAIKSSPFSQSKRKRTTDQFPTKRLNKSHIAPDSLKSRVRTIKKVDMIAQAWIDSGHELSGHQLLQSGEFLCCQQNTALLFSELQSSSTSCAVIPFDELDFDVRNCCISVSIDENSSRKYIIGIDMSGNTIIRSVLSDGTVTNANDGVAYKMKFLEQDEFPSCITSKGVKSIVGTTRGSLYLLTREGVDVVSIEPLQKNRNLIYGILRSGAKLLGLTPSSSSSSPATASIMKPLPIRLSDSEYLLAVAPQSLSLWSGWTGLGSERQLWTCPLSSLLEEDAQYMLGQFVGRLFLVDACMMPLPVEEADLGVLLLSACRVPPAQENGHDSFNLFLHYLEFSPGAPPTRSTQRAVLAIGVDDFGAFPRQAKPRLHSELPIQSMLVVASWVFRGSLRASQVDVASLDFVTSEAGEEVRVGPHIVEIISSLDSLAPMVDSGVSADHVLAAGLLAGGQGLVLLTRDGLLTALQPPLPGRYSQQPMTSKQLTSLSNRFPPTSPGVIEDLILVIVKGDDEFGDTDICQQVLSSTLSQIARQAPHSPQEVMERLSLVVREVSYRLINRSAAAESITATDEGIDSILSRPGESLAHRLLQHKTQLHTRLVRTLLGVTEWVTEPTQNLLLRDHELLLAAAELCNVMQEAQFQVQSTSYDEASGSAIDNKGFLAIARRNSMKFVREGVAEHTKSDENYEVSSEIGLSIEDLFFGNVSTIPDGLVVIATNLNAANVNSSDFFPSVYGFLSLILSYVQAPEVAPKASSTGPDAATTLVLCNPLVRRAVYLSLDTAFRTSEFLHFSDERSSPLGFRRDREGVRVKDLCTALLRGYAVEAALAGTPGGSSLSDLASGLLGLPLDSPAAFLDACHRSAAPLVVAAPLPLSWQEEHSACLEVCVPLLLRLGYTSTAFTLSAHHLHAPGLMAAVDQARPALLPSLHKFLHLQGSARSAAGSAVAAECLHWMEATAPTHLGPLKQSSARTRGGRQYRTDDILEAGRHIDKHIFDEFLSGRPLLSWLYSTRLGHFDIAAVNAVLFLQSKEPTVAPLASAKSVLSMAKLCAVAMDAEEEATEVGLRALESRLQADRGLLEVFAQEQLLESQAGRVAGEVPTKMRPELLITEMHDTFYKRVVSSIQSRGQEERNDVLFVGLILALLTEQLNCRRQDDEVDADSLTFIANSLGSVWSTIILADLQLFLELIDDEGKGCSSDMLELKMTGGDAGSGLLTIQLLRAHYKDAKEGKMDPQVLLSLRKPASDIMVRNLAGESAQLVAALVGEVFKVAGRYFSPLPNPSLLVKKIEQTLDLVERLETSFVDQAQ